MDGMRKRKCLDLLEDREQLLTTKSRRLMVEDSKTTYGTTNLRTLSPLHLLLGAKSGTWREETKRRRRDDTIGIDLGQLRDNEKDESGHSQGISDLRTRTL